VGVRGLDTRVQPLSCPHLDHAPPDHTDRPIVSPFYFYQHNALRTVAGLPPSLTHLDLSHNLLGDRLHLRVLSLAPLLRIVRIAGNPVADRQSVASRVTITSILPALEQLDDLLLPGRKVRKSRPPPAPTMSTTMTTTMTTTQASRRSADAEPFFSNTMGSNGSISGGAPPPSRASTGSLPGAALSATSPPPTTPSGTVDFGHNFSPPKRSRSPSGGGVPSPPSPFDRPAPAPAPAPGGSPLSSPTVASKADDASRPKRLPVIRLNRKCVDANNKRLARAANVRESELAEMEAAVHAQARRMQVRVISIIICTHR